MPLGASPAWAAREALAATMLHSRLAACMVEARVVPSRAPRQTMLEAMELAASSGELAVPSLPPTQALSLLVAPHQHCQQAPHPPALRPWPVPRHLQPRWPGPRHLPLWPARHLLPLCPALRPLPLSPARHLLCQWPALHLLAQWPARRHLCLCPARPCPAHLVGGVLTSMWARPSTTSWAR